MKIAVVGGFGVAETMVLSSAPKAGETVSGGYFSAGPGGKGSNQAVQISRLGTQSLLATAVGSDSYAQIGRDLWEAEGVETTAVVTVNAPTMIGFIIVDQEGENRIALAPGALDAIDPAAMEPSMSAILECDMVVVSWELSPQIGQDIIKRAKRAGLATVCNTAPAVAIPDDVLECLDYVIPNEGEALTIANLKGWPTDSLDSIAMAFKASGARNVIITLGSDGVLLVSDDETVRIPAVPARQVVDTTGAGDSFVGAFAHAIAHGIELKQAARFAATAASLAVESLEVIPSLPTIQDVENRLQEVA